MNGTVAELVRRLEQERKEIDAVLTAIKGNGQKKKKWSKAQRAKFMATLAKRKKK